MYSINPSCCEQCTVNTVSSTSPSCTACSGKFCQVQEEKTYEYTPAPGLTVQQCCAASPGTCGPTPPNYRWKISQLVTKPGIVGTSDVDACRNAGGTWGTTACNCTSSTSGGLLWRYVENLSATPPSCDGGCVCDSTTQCCVGDRLMTNTDCPSGKTLNPSPTNPPNDCCICPSCPTTTTTDTIITKSIYGYTFTQDVFPSDLCEDRTITYQETTTTEITTSGCSASCVSAGCCKNGKSISPPNTVNVTVVGTVPRHSEKKECIAKGGSWKLVNGSNTCECQDEKKWTYNQSTKRDVNLDLDGCRGKCYCDSSQCCGDKNTAKALRQSHRDRIHGQVINTTQDCQDQFGADYVFDSNSSNTPRANCQCVKTCPQGKCCDSNNNVVTCCDSSGNLVSNPQQCDTTGSYTFHKDTSTPPICSCTCSAQCCDSSTPSQPIANPCCNAVGASGVIDGTNQSSCVAGFSLDKTNSPDCDCKSCNPGSGQCCVNGSLITSPCCDATGNLIDSTGGGTCYTANYTLNTTDGNNCKCDPKVCPDGSGNDILIADVCCNANGKIVNGTANPGLCNLNYNHLDSNSVPTCICNCVEKPNSRICCGGSNSNTLLMSACCDKKGNVIDGNIGTCDSTKFTYSQCACAAKSGVCIDSRGDVFSSDAECRAEHGQNYYFDTSNSECCSSCSKSSSKN